MERKKIAVLFGGRSPEYGVSLQSAHAVITHMDRGRFQSVLIGITQEGGWYYYSGPADCIPSDTWFNAADCTPARLSPDPRDRALLLEEGDTVRRIVLDAAFPVLHGQNGEDGTVQGLLQLAGVPVVGCGVLASALCMDKDRAHKLAHAAGIAVPASVVVEKSCPEGEALARCTGLEYPLFVKPVRAGSSYGITKVGTAQELPAALGLAFQYDGQAIVEEAVPGFEVGCAVLGNEELTVGEPDEIELAQGFFNFTEKYTLETSAIHVPARIPPEKRREVQETAKVIYRALDCRGFARVDCFLRPDGEIVFNEVNTIPGFTAHSRYPNMMKAVGLPFADLVTRVIELAVME